MVSCPGYFGGHCIPGISANAAARGSLASSAPVLAALGLSAVLAGVAAGGLSASILALLISGALRLADVDNGPDIGLVVGVVAGLVVGGWVAGSRAVHSHRFHGMVTGLLLAFVIVVVARLGGSPASTPTVMWLALLSVTISGLFGFLAGRRAK